MRRWPMWYTSLQEGVSAAMIQTAIQIAMIFGMIGVGFLATKRAWFPETFSAQLSTLLIRVFYPSLLFSAILRRYTLATLAENWILPVGAGCIILVGWCVGWVAKRWLVRGVRAPTRRAFHFTCTMNNYSFLPIMLVAGMPLGERGVAMVALTTIATDTLMWTLGFRTFTGQRLQWRNLPAIFCRPPILALALAIGLLFILAPFGVTNTRLLSMPLTGAILNTLYTYLGGATIPTSALVCGMCLARIHPKGLLGKHLLLATAFRMLIIPTLLLTLLILIPLDPAQRLVFGIIALMPGAMVGVSMAEVYGGDTAFISGMILNTHLLCIITVPLGLALLNALT